MKMKKVITLCCSGLTVCLLAESSLAADWSNTEVQYQVGRLENPFTREKATTNIVTLQHVSGWKYGDNFFFVDFSNDSKTDGFNDSDAYAEFYANFSAGKITGKRVGVGPIKDVGILLGVNYGADANVLKYLPGVRLSWDIPGFAFLNTDITAYIDDSEGVNSINKGSAPKEDASYMLDINWKYPFGLGSQSFSIEGHAEWIGSRDNQFGQDVKSWILAQPQVRWDMGKALTGTENKLYLGIEYQYWWNKLGIDASDESVVQGLVVWAL